MLLNTRVSSYSYGFMLQQWSPLHNYSMAHESQKGTTIQCTIVVGVLLPRLAIITAGAAQSGTMPNVIPEPLLSANSNECNMKTWWVLQKKAPLKLHGSEATALIMATSFPATTFSVSQQCACIMSKRLSSNRNNIRNLSPLCIGLLEALQVECNHRTPTWF